LIIIAESPQNRNESSPHPANAGIYTFGVWGMPLIRRSNYKARVFVPSNVTPERLLSFFEDNIAINATELTKRYIGQWMPVTGALRNVTAYGQVSFEKNATPLTWFDYADILCYFRESKIDDLKILKRGDKITVIGQISRIGKLDLELYNCELVES
jgi:tRNA_anti-like